MRGKKPAAKLRPIKIKSISDIHSPRKYVPKRDNNTTMKQCVPIWDNVLEWDNGIMAYFCMILPRHIASFVHTYTYNMV